MDFDSKDFIGRPPGRLARIGIQVVASILCIVLVASLIVEYRDVMQAQIEVMPVLPPIVLKTKRTGQIASFLVDPGDSV